MFDSILYYQQLAYDRYKLSEIIDVEPEKYFLATVHRQENTDNIDKLQQIFKAFSELDMPVIVPLHPRTQKLMDEVPFRSNVKIIDPVGYLQMIILLMNSCKVLTDSGGLQKEAFFLRKPCITLREETEWIETLNGGWNFIVGTDHLKITEKVNFHEFGLQGNYFGDGKSAEKIVDYLLSRNI